MFKKSSAIFILSIIFICQPGPRTAGCSDNFKEISVRYVIDGDTIETADGMRVRYLGIDTPERDEPLFEEAKERNKALLRGKSVKIEICKEEPVDKYGRTLAWVFADGELVNATILREGYARLLLIPPCGLKRAKEFKREQLKAIKNGVGLWSGIKTIPPRDARRYIGRYARVRGRITDIHDSGKALFLNFSRKRGGFYGIIFYDDLEEFRKSGVSPEDYLGKDVSITGRIKKYKGTPEIIIELPSQIEANSLP